MYQIIRNLFPPYMAKFARQAVEEIIADGDIVSLPEGQVNVWKLQRGVRLVSPPDSIVQIIQAMVAHIGLPCDPERSSLRKQDVLPGWPRLPWHQDGASMDLKEGQRAVVSWVPLDPIDGTRPTLEVSEEEDVPLITHERNDVNHLAADGVPKLATTVLIGLKPGDVVLFSPLTLHRTYFAEGMTNPRLSLDLRFFGPSA